VYVSEFDALTTEDLIAIILELRKRMAALEAENEDLRSRLGGGEKSTPEWVKPNRKERREQERKDRKQRQKSFVRRREEPTEIVQHAVDNCPDCGRRLNGGWVHKRRQVIEIPEVKVRVIEHQAMARRCGVCGKIHIPKMDLEGQVIGKMRIGTRAMSFVAQLGTVCRMPIAQIQGLLNTVYKLHLSAGEISAILQTTARIGEKEYERLRDEVRGSPVVHADETGWREDGVNGYIWSFSTPLTRYFVHKTSRAAEVAKTVLGEHFKGKLVCDFYSAYGALNVVCQRCWVHLFRDLKKLKEAHPDKPDVAEWTESIKAVYDLAKGFESHIPRQRLKAKMILERKLMSLALPYLGVTKPQRILAQRIEKHLAELFVFVEDPRVPSDNNAAERSVRPSVIARKISGGTRSENGSTTRTILMSLFGTWTLRGLDTFTECHRLLAHSRPATAIHSTQA
jgi:transposase